MGHTKPTSGLDHRSVSAYSCTMTTIAPPQKKLQARAIDRRTAIVNTAWQLICERGFDDTGVNSIIAVLGISKGSFYHHFESKVAVIDAVAEMLTKELSQRVAADNANATALDRLIAFVRSGWEWHHDHTAVSTHLSVVMLREENSELLARITATEHRVLHPLLEEIIEQGRQQQSFAVPNATLATDLILPMVSDSVIRIMRAVIAERLTASDLIVRLQFLQYAVEQILGAAVGSLNTAFPINKASRQQAQRLIDTLGSLSKPEPLTSTGKQ